MRSEGGEKGVVKSRVVGESSVDFVDSYQYFTVRCTGPGIWFIDVSVLMNKTNPFGL